MSLDLDAYNAAQGTPDAIWIAVHFYGRIRRANLSDPAFIARGRAARARASTYAGSGGAVGARSTASKQQAQVYTVLTYLGTTAEERRWGLRFVRAWLRGGRAAAERVLAQGGLSSGASASASATTSAPRGAALGPWLAQQAGAVQQRRQQQQARSPYRSPFQAGAPAAPRYPTPVVAAPSFQPSFRASPPPGAATRPREDRSGGSGGVVIDLDAYRQQGRGSVQPRVRWDASGQTFRRTGGGSGPSATVAPGPVLLDPRLPPSGITAATSIAPTLDNVALSTDEASSPYSGLGAAPIGASPYDRVKPFLLPAAALLVAALVASKAGGSAGSSSRRRRNGRRARRNQSPKTRR